MAFLRGDGKLINALDSKTKLYQAFEVAVMDPSFVVKASPDCRRYTTTSSFLSYRTTADCFEEPPVVSQLLVSSAYPESSTHLLFPTWLEKTAGPERKTTAITGRC